MLLIASRLLSASLTILALLARENLRLVGRGRDSWAYFNCPWYLGS